MWLLATACVNPYPEAFEWRIDHTIVAGIAVDPAVARNGAARTVDALVLSPWEIEETHWEICGFDPTRYEAVFASCFSEAGLVEEVATGLSATFTLPAVSFTCPESSYPSTTGSLATSEPVDDCESTIPLRLHALSPEDEGFGSVQLFLPAGERGPEPAIDADQIELRVDVIDGEPVAGGEVVLEASELNLPPTPGDDRVVRWYVDDGELLGTGRTRYTGTIPPSERATSRNVLRIPNGWRGPLRVAVVTRVGTVWTVKTLEVP